MTTNDLEIFQNLSLHVTNAPLSVIRESLIKQVAPPWKHEVQKENDLKRLGSGGEDIIVFSRESDSKAPTVGLVLWEDSEGYKVANIVPKESGSISIATYNAVLQDFVGKLVKPAADENEFRINLTESRQTVKDWLGEAPAAALRSFSGAANKSTGASHPKDQERWFNFLIAAHRSGHRADPETLRRWLVEVDSWPEDEASDLAADYETALALLLRYDSH